MIIHRMPTSVIRAGLCIIWSAITLVCLGSPSRAEVLLCNKSSYDIRVALGTQADAQTWRSHGYYPVQSGKCNQLSNYAGRYFYLYVILDQSATRVRGLEAPSDIGKRFCVVIPPDFLSPFNLPYSDRCEDVTYGTSAQFAPFDSGPNRDCWVELKADLGYSMFCRVKSAQAQLQERCLISYDDSHQIHSNELIIKWNYQANKTVAKRLHHCIKLRVFGPISIEGVAKKYVDHCIEKGLNHQRTRYVIQALVSLGVDVLSKGATKGSVTAATLTDYVNSAASETLECLSDAEGFSDHAEQALKDQFKATIDHEMEWIYWNL
jgi:uncharacterized membrane protein